MKKYFSEFLGTYILVFLGCATAVFTGGDPLTIAFVFGIAVLISASSQIGSISGAHLNPAVSLAFFVNGKLDLKDLIGYIVSQFAGGIVAAFSLSQLVSQTTASGLGANGFETLSPLNTTLIAAFIIELLVTAIFVFVIMNVAGDKNAGLIIALSLVGLILVAFNLTGASLNPARSLGPALFTGELALSQVWVFLVAPSLGGIIGGLAHRMLKQKSS